jgi:hypothetical protein
VTFTAGVGSASGITLTDVQTTTLTATQGALTGTSPSFTVAGGTANSFTVANAGGQTAGTAFSDTITAIDASGNTATSYSGSQALAFSGPANSPDGTAPTYPATVSFTAGVGTAAGITLTDAQNTTLTATQGTVTGTSASFAVAAGSGDQLVFTTQTTGAGATSPTTVFPVQPAVTAEDTYGNTATGYTTGITLKLTTTAMGTLTCTTNPKPPTSGVSTFAGCRGSKVGTNLTLTATSGTLSAISASFNITKAPSKLVFTTQPSTSTTAGAAFATQPVVSVEDSSSNLVTADSTTSVLLAATVGSGSLTCTDTSITVTLGVAPFDSCSIAVSGSYKLSAAASGFTTVNSSTITINTGPASQVAFTTQPGGGGSGAAWGTGNQPVVTVEDSSGNTVTSSTASVTLSISSQPGTGATLACTGSNSKAATSGVATFAGCNITGTAGSYTLSATATGLTADTSNSFTIFGVASQVVFTTQPGGGGSGAAWGTGNQPVATVEDSLGNTVTSSTASVTLSISSQPGSGATLACTGGNSKAATSGVATFAGCNITGTVGSYTLSATASGLTADSSNSFTITAGAATKLVFTTQPGGGARNTIWSTQPVVTVEDSAGNTVTSNVSVTLAVSAHPNFTGTLSCPINPVTATSGVAAFSGCKITGGSAGTYSLTATSGTLTAATSSTFAVS